MFFRPGNRFGQISLRVDFILLHLAHKLVICRLYYKTHIMVFENIIHPYLRRSRLLNIDINFEVVQLHLTWFLHLVRLFFEIVASGFG